MPVPFETLLPYAIMVAVRAGEGPFDLRIWGAHILLDVWCDGNRTCGLQDVAE